MLDSKIKKIVLTGGPCAGKSTILREVENHLKDQGYYVITVSETAAEMITNNMLPFMEEDKALEFQDMLLKMQVSKERTAQRYAEKFLTDKKVVILCDRGIMDNRAYLSSGKDFNYLLEKNGLDELQVIHSYDLVLDLISTATTKKEHYVLDGVRSESLEQAALIDKKTTLAWITHPRLVNVKPTDSIEEKTQIVTNEIDNFLNGIEYNKRRSAVINNKNDLSVLDDDECRVVDVNKTYLKDDMVLTHKRCGNSSIMLLGKYNNSFFDRIVAYEEAIDTLYDKPIVFTEQFREIGFVEDGNVYKLIDNNKNHSFEYDIANTAYEIKSAVDSMNKKFVKIKEQC